MDSPGDGQRPDSKDQNNPQTPNQEGITECLELGVQMRVSSRHRPRHRTAHRMDLVPYTNSPRRTPLWLNRGGRRTNTPVGGSHQSGSSLVGSGYVAGGHGSSPSLAGASASSSTQGSLVIPPKPPLQTRHSLPDLLRRQQQNRTSGSSSSTDLSRQPPFVESSFAAMYLQFQQLNMAPDQGFLRSPTPLHQLLSYVGSPGAASIATTSQSSSATASTSNVNLLAVEPVGNLEAIVRTALSLIGNILRAYTNRINLASHVVSSHCSLIPLLSSVALSFETIASHPDARMVFEKVDVNLFGRMSARIAELTVEVQYAIQQHENGHNFNLSERLESLLVGDLQDWFGVLEQFQSAI